MNTLPTILTANTHLWQPATAATNRRISEERNLGIVEHFLRSIGFTTQRFTNTVHGSRDGIKVKFFYMESPTRVFKALSVSKDGKKSNITTLKKLL